jgi:hypothetical protein
MNNKKINTKIGIITGLLCFGLSFNSCEDYLDKAPAASYTENGVFGNFTSFQGWVEEMYVCMTRYLAHIAVCSSFPKKFSLEINEFRVSGKLFQGNSEI